jgi:GT2 family glycosyltransferase
MVSDWLVSIIIITRNRPQMLQACLKHLKRQTVAPDEVIVVDSSTGEDTQAVLDAYPQVVRLRIPDGRNNRPQAKNLGIAHASGDIIAFLDDDSMAQPDWLRFLLGPYADPSVGGVGGRVIDALEQARATPDDTRIGVVQHEGKIKMTTNFILDPGHPVEVDHLVGCNMSFRKDALLPIGGFDHNYTGGNTLEETDVCIRVKRAGYRLIFEPRAVVDHLGVRWLGFQERAPGILEFFHGTKNYAYFFFKNFGIRLRVLQHVFGRVPLHRLRTLLSEPSLRNFRSMITALPGSFAGLAISLLQHKNEKWLGGSL